MLYTLDFEIMGTPPSLNARLHWRARHRENAKWKSLVGTSVLLFHRPPYPLPRAKLTLTKFSIQRPDYDNLVTSMKPIIDGLVECGVLVDDHWDIIGMPDCRWEKCSHKNEARIRVRVESVSS